MNALTPPREARQESARLSGERIRQRRLMIGLKQAALADAVGISASYLNLIEHNRRKIGGKLLIELARALGVEASELAEGADATVHNALRLAALDLDAMGTAPEIDRIDDLAARFPGWTELITAQSKRLADLEATVAGLRDRISHDPVLSETMHEVLSCAAAIRSTADILARERDLEAPWLARFHRNLDEEARRLSERTTEMLGHFELPDDGT